MGRKLSSLAPSPAMAVSVAALLAASGGLAIAASSSGPVIRACANKKTGALRLAAKCRRGERSVSWNQFGPAGATGKTGPTGRAGMAGAVGATGAPGVQGPGATSLSATIADGSTQQPLAVLGNGVTVQGNCNHSAVLQIKTTSGLGNLQASGTGFESGAAAVGPVRADSAIATSLSAPNFVEFDVIARDKTVGGFARIDALLEYGEPSCTFWAMIAPSS
jgi:hypothetical protein